MTSVETAIVTVNGRTCSVERSAMLTYREVVRLAGLDPRSTPTVTYRRPLDANCWASGRLSSDIPDFGFPAATGSVYNVMRAGAWHRILRFLRLE